MYKDTIGDQPAQPRSVSQSLLPGMTTDDATECSQEGVDGGVTMEGKAGAALLTEDAAQTRRSHPHTHYGRRTRDKVG